MIFSQKRGVQLMHHEVMLQDKVPETRRVDRLSKFTCCTSIAIKYWPKKHHEKSTRNTYLLMRISESDSANVMEQGLECSCIRGKSREYEITIRIQIQQACSLNHHLQPRAIFISALRDPSDSPEDSP